MKLKLKKQVWQIMLIFPLFLFGNDLIAQTPALNQSYSNAKDYFYNGQYQYVYQTLAPNVADIQGANKAYYQGNPDGMGMVFRVYKMIIDSEYKLNQIERAEWFENWVINFFTGIYLPEQVYDYLDYAQL